MNRIISFFKRLKEVSHTNLFLRKHTPAPFIMQLLKRFYPAVDWTRVDFYEGLPWFAPLVAPYVTAQALPQFYSCSRFRIYIKKFDESQPDCVADIIHEAFHILQYMETGKGYGFGFLRGMMVYYIAFFVKYGYRQNPFEIPAYEQEYRFMKYCHTNGITEIVPDKTIKVFESVDPTSGLIFNTYSFKYDYSKLVLSGAFVFCFFIALVKPLADTLLFLIRITTKKEKIKQPCGAKKNPV